MVTTGNATRADRAATYVALQNSASFIRLRSRSRRYIAATTALFLGSVVATVALAAWLPGPVGLLFAIALTLLPALISSFHLGYARRRLDPPAERIREEFATIRPPGS